jgi:glycosyltransferase involved in cell wall biosynthesis
MPSSSLLFNLSFVGNRPTGLANYGLNLVRHLELSNLTVLRPVGTELPGSHDQISVPDRLSPDEGKWGHARRLAWTQWQLPQIYRKMQADLLFSPIPEAPLWAGCRSVVVVHDLIPLRFPNWRSPLTYYFRYYIPQVLAQSVHIICNSEATAQDVQDIYQVPAQRITPIPLAHDGEHFRPGQPVDLSLVYPDAAHHPYFLYVGRHDPYKNIHRLITAFAQLPDQDCHLVIAGSYDPRYTPTLQAQAQELGIAQQVKFLDYVPYAQLPGLMGQAIALVFPSLWEGFGFPVLEAMACGTPVITSHRSSLPEVAGDAAILIDPFQVEEISAAMQWLLTDDRTRSQLSTAGLDRAAQFSWHRTAQQTQAVLEQI